MLLPRPARILRQGSYIYPRSLSYRSIHASASTRRLNVVGTQEDDHDSSFGKDNQKDVAHIQLDRPFQYYDPFESHSSFPTSSSSSSSRRTKLKSLPQNLVESELQSISSRIGDLDTVSKSKRREQTPFGMIRDETVEEEEVDEDEEDMGPREARKSPAALLGSKRLELTILPPELLKGISDAIEDVDPKMVRQQYLRLREQQLKSPQDRKRPRVIEPEMAVAAAAAFLPGEYAAVRNVLEELERRLGSDWLEEAAKRAKITHMEQEVKDGVRSMEVSEEEMRDSQEKLRPRIFEASASLGPGLWAMMDARDSLPSAREDGAVSRGPVDYQLYHGPSHTKSMASKLAKGISEDAASLDLPPKFDRSFISTTPALTMSTFFLSTLPESSRRRHVRSLINFKSPYTIIIDHARRQGWDGISKAREYILSLSTPENPLHIVAPCPHDQACPMMGGRDICGFSQLHQSPEFTRKTKHSKRGQEDKQYVYLVVGRGERPSSSTLGGDLWQIGRMGGVAKDQLRKEVNYREGKSVLREVEGSENGEIQYEMIPLAEAESQQRSIDGEAEPVDFEGVNEADMLDSLREEAFSWPRLVAPPIKSSGHVIMDVCSQNGDIERMTIPKSHSKQGYHDARKSFWGDIFPHEPKGRVVPRTRGVKRLSSPLEDEDPEGLFDELFGRESDRQETYESFQALKAMPGVKITDNSSARRTKGPEQKKEDKRKEEAKMDKFYRHVRPEQFDGFPLDTQPKEWRLSKGHTAGAATNIEKRMRRDSKSEKRHLLGKDRSTSEGWDGRRGFSTFTRPVIGLGSASSFVQRRYMSVRPAERVGRPKVTIAELAKMKEAGTPITVLTAYDFPTSLLSESAGVDMVLVGDSLSQVALGHDTTTAITLDEMIHHAKAVTRGAKTPFVFADLPFGSFESSTEKGVESTIRIIKEGGVDGVKIEGGREIIPLVERLGSMGLAVIPHLGLQPQRATSTSGYLVQGRSADSADHLLQTALDLERAGATAILLEAIPHLLAAHITERLSIPTIGIGAGPQTSGQVLVITDVLGTYAPDRDVEAEGGGKSAGPRFVRQFGNVGQESRRAVNEYIAEVKGRTFPQVGKETYGMKKDEWEAFMKRQEGK